MKTALRCLALSLSLSFFLAPPGIAAAGEGRGSGVGNGGGLWTCRDAADALVWSELVDLSEARREFRLNILRQLPLNREGWLRAVDAKLRQADPEYYAAYRKQLAEVRARFTLVPESDFTGTEDFKIRTRPEQSTCPGGTMPMNPEQLANFTHQGKLIVHQGLWLSNKLGEIDRAALLVHEAIYKLLRETQGDTDSAKAREIVGYLFSDLPLKRYAYLLKLAPPASQGQGKPFVPVTGTFRATSGDWYPIEITDFDAAAGRLYLTEKNKNGTNRNSHVFRCTRQGLEYRCNMVQTTNWFIRWLRGGVVKHRLRFVDPSTFVWYNLRPSGAVRATRYAR